MPELPEVESIRRTLHPFVIGQGVTQARLLRADYCRREDGKPCAPRDLLQGSRIVELARRGKQLAMVAENGRVLIVQLGMSGSLRVLEPGAAQPPTHVHALWILESGVRLVSRDPRRFGGLTALGSREALEARWAQLGPDALTISGKELLARASGSQRAIKALLLDQGVLAGVGNIYADEALFLARVHPLRAAAGLSPQECGRLATGIIRSLQLALDAGGSTIRDYINANGTSGGAQAGHQVYGRGGQECRRCGQRLRLIRVAQRATVFCPQCQPRRKTRVKQA